jgi:SnoaL-like domain
VTGTQSPPVDVRALAIRFADLWAVDPHQMVEEIYTPDLAMQSMAKPAPPIRGAHQLHALEDRLAELIPEHRHELVRVLLDGQRAFLETTVVGPTTHEYAQAAVWWTLDGAGKVNDEIGWFDWEHRTTNSIQSRGTVPPDDRRPRGAKAYEQLVRDAVRRWADDPAELVAACTPGCVVDLVGRTSWHGPDAVANAVHAARAAAPGAIVDVLRVLGDGGVAAALVQISAGDRTTRGTVVLTLDADDRITSVRLYVDWSRAGRRDTSTDQRKDQGA